MLAQWYNPLSQKGGLSEGWFHVRSLLMVIELFDLGNMDSPMPLPSMIGSCEISIRGGKKCI